MRQQCIFLVSWLIDKRLKEKDGTQSTLVKIKVPERHIEPIWVTKAVSPLRSSTIQLTSVKSINRWMECTIWFVAPMSMTKVSPSKVVLFVIWAEILNASNQDK